MMLVIPKGYAQAEPTQMPSAEAIAEMMKYNEALAKAGALLALAGLHPPAEGARVTFAAGRATVTDGPFTETKEAVGGYWLIQVKSREEALEWARRCPMQDGDTIEVRQVQELGEFPTEDIPPLSPELKKLAEGA